MKWIVLAGALCASLSVPLWIKQRPEYSRWIWIAFGLLPFLLYPMHLYMALRSWAEWPGYAKGIEVTLLDLLAIGLLLSLPPARLSLPFKLSMSLYFVAATLSCFQTAVFETSLAYVVQLARVFLVYAAVAKASADEEVSDAILMGLALGIGIQAIAVVVQRFGLGQLQASGTFVHQNSLGLASHFVAFPFFALFLRQKKGWLGVPLAVLTACILVQVLTVSRATIGLAGFGYCLIFLLSAWREWSARKAVIGSAGLAALLILVPVVIASLAERTNIITEAEYDERAAFESAAASILSDNPLGIGANNYVVVANSRGYNEKAGVVPTANSLVAHVHNAYYLVAAETGWPGILSFVLMLAVPLVYAFRQSHRLRKSRQGHVLLGLAMALLVSYLHSAFEWALMGWALQYFVAITFGLVVGSSRQSARSATRHSLHMPNSTNTVASKLVT